MLRRVEHEKCFYLESKFTYYLSEIMRFWPLSYMATLQKNCLPGFGQMRLKCACSATETSYNIEINPLYMGYPRVKTQMICCIMQHFIRVYTVCICKKDLQTKK